MRINRIGRGAGALLAAVVLSSITPGQHSAKAQPALCAEPKGGEGRGGISPWALRLLGAWTEVEGEWNGRWTPIEDRNGHYSAVWTKHGERARADLQITPTDDSHVTIVRTQREGTCTYRGTLWPEGWHVNGTYTCTWAGAQTLRWSAAIARGYQPEAHGCDEALPAVDPRLTAIWREQEGDWAGSWTPVSPPGDFRAGWHKGREWANADLHMTLDDNRIAILRSQGQGTCHYEGQFTGNGWRASGTYYCSWNHNRMPWSATIGSGSPPTP